MGSSNQSNIFVIAGIKNDVSVLQNLMHHDKIFISKFWEEKYLNIFIIKISGYEMSSVNSSLATSILLLVFGKSTKTYKSL